MPSKPRSATKWGKVLVSVAIVVGIGVAIAPSLTLKGVPLPIIFKFLTDGPAREAYFDKDKATLHDRLQELNIENEIKDYYRPQFQDEQELDLHIHQVFYDLSGYIGKSYVVTSQGTLKLRDLDFQFWARLAEEVGVISDSYYSTDGIPYVVSKEGIVARYETIAPLYPRKWLKKKLRKQRGAKKT
ncbi:hypothetical protein [Acaryochloris thomasi]|nr:hypothetical protein [Acaryochloris thomasi]